MDTELICLFKLKVSGVVGFLFLFFCNMSVMVMVFFLNVDKCHFTLFIVCLFGGGLFCFSNVMYNNISAFGMTKD